MDKLVFVTLMETLIALGSFVALFFALYYYLRFRNRERMLMIEKNANAAEIFKRREIRFPWFITGFTLLGIGFGFALGLLIMQGFGIDVPMGPMMTIAFAVLFGGAGMILGSLLEKKQKQNG